MYCSNCGTNIKDSSDKFCSKCGIQVDAASKVSIVNQSTNTPAKASDNHTDKSQVKLEGYMLVAEFAEKRNIEMNKVIKMIRDGFYQGRLIDEKWYISTSEYKDSSSKNTPAASGSENPNEGYFERLHRISNSEGFQSLPFSERWRLIFSEAPKKHKTIIFIGTFFVSLGLVALIGDRLEIGTKSYSNNEKSISTTNRSAPVNANTSSKSIYEWAQILKGTDRDAVVRMLGKPDYAQEDGKVAGGAVRFIQYVYRDRVENEHTGKLDNLYIVFDWNSTRKISAGATGKELDLMFPGY
jgi:hypothetical protein